MSANNTNRTTPDPPPPESNREQEKPTLSGRLLQAGIGVLVDPVTFLSLIAPMILGFIVSITAQRMQGEHRTTTQCPCETLDGFLGSPFLPGFTDFIFQNSLVILAGTVLFLKCLHTMAEGATSVASGGRKLSAIEKRAVGLLTVLLVIIAVFAIQMSSTPQTLDIYIQLIKRFGDYHFPPPESPITQFRGLIFLLGVAFLAVTDWGVVQLITQRTETNSKDD